MFQRAYADSELGVRKGPWDQGPGLHRAGLLSAWCWPMKNDGRRSPYQVCIMAPTNMLIKGPRARNLDSSSYVTGRAPLAMAFSTVRGRWGVQGRSQAYNILWQ